MMYDILKPEAQCRQGNRTWEAREEEEDPVFRIKQCLPLTCCTLDYIHSCINYDTEKRIIRVYKSKK